MPPQLRMFMRTTFIPAANALLPTPTIYCESLEPSRPCSTMMVAASAAFGCQCEWQSTETPRSTSTIRASDSPNASSRRMKLPAIVCQWPPRRRLRGGHWQTIAGNFMRREDALGESEARMVEVDRGVSVLCHSHWQPNAADAATIIVLHGLEGSSDSQYMVGVGNKAFAAGMNVVRMNMRNCGGMDDTSTSLYHS